MGEASSARGRATPVQVRQVRDALRREFTDLVDLGDYEGRQEVERQRAFLSRSMAALVARSKAGCDSRTAAAMVVDGRDDHGIDAIAVADGGHHLWLIQSKWSDRGTAGFSVADALKLNEGLTHIDQHNFTVFNSRVRGMAERIRAVLQDPRVQIRLVVALMGTEPVSADVERRLKEMRSKYNGFGDVLDYEVYLAPDIWQIIRDDFAAPPIELTARMQQWIHLSEPYDAYYGTVPVGEIAAWYAEHGDRLFERNIRRSLGLTAVNSGLVQTLRNDPQSFWYFNNGITVLCDRIEPQLFSRSDPRGPVALHLAGASVVNGAQTVTATHEALGDGLGPDAGSGYIGVKVVSMKGSPDDFDSEITKATNTQNHVERRSSPSRPRSARTSPPLCSRPTWSSAASSIRHPRRAARWWRPQSRWPVRITEREALKAWLAEDSRRAVASWVNDRSKPLLWSADSRRYSPSGLVGEMYKLANWDEAPVAVQGPARWAVPGEGILVELADGVLADQDLAGPA